MSCMGAACFYSPTHYSITSRLIPSTLSVDQMKSNDGMHDEMQSFSIRKIIPSSFFHSLFLYHSNSNSVHSQSKQNSRAYLISVIDGGMQQSRTTRELELYVYAARSAVWWTWPSSQSSSSSSSSSSSIEARFLALIAILFIKLSVSSMLFPGWTHTWKRVV